MSTMSNHPFPRVPVDRILPNPEQPRTEFNKTELQELADSIKEHGVIQPIAVEQAGEYYILHDGERRWRAAQLAGVKTIPAVISPPLNGSAPADRLTRALVANIQRSAMSPVEEALAIRRMRNEFGMKPKEIAGRLSKSYTIIANRLQLAALDAEILALMQAKQLSTEPKVVNALRSINHDEARIALARALAEQKASAKLVTLACSRWHKFHNVQAAIHPRGHSASDRGAVSAETAKPKGTPAMMAIHHDPESWPEWYALYQLGKVPPWPMINDQVMHTCDSCALRHVASDSTCGQCPLVTMLKGLMEAVNGSVR